MKQFLFFRYINNVNEKIKYNNVKILHLLFFVIFLTKSLLSFSQTDNIDKQVKMIEICIDSTIAKAGHSKDAYIIDFSNSTFWNKEAIKKYLAKNTLHSQGILDSIVKHDQNWIKYEVLSQKVIRFAKIEIINDKTIKIAMSHFMSSDGSFGLEIILEERNGVYECKSVKRTWMS